MAVSRLRYLIGRVEAAVAWCCTLPVMVILPLLIGVSVYDIIGRQFYNTGSTRLQELEWHLFLTLVMVSIGYAYLRDIHVRIDVFRDRASDRTKAIVEIVGYFVALVPFCLVVVAYGSELAAMAFTTGERSRAAMGLPMRWIIKSTLPFGALILLLAGSCAFGRNVLFLLGEEPRPAPGGDR
ncbi:TRAP transporter small permease subunit [Pelagibius marinus]|uniref:TRAP transporter small permease subunit n=1 Tax=Pelagibius marinus TaxID=2762760 RepID=UPI00187303E2|nr:TRAP transporter small permease subunit [Pelagibius marinus]